MLGSAGRLLAALVALGALLWPAFAQESGDPTGVDDPATVTDYTASLVVDREGTLRATERITTEMPPGRHGIYRFWDVSDASDPNVRLVPKDLEVTQDGGDAEVDYSWQYSRRYRVARIGDADVELSPGRHVYEISYRIDGVLAEADGGAELVWDVVPLGLQMPVQHGEVRIGLPVAPHGAHCATYPGQVCRADVSRGGVVVTTGPFEARHGATVHVPLDLAAPGRVTLPWPVRYDGVLPRSVLLVVLLLLLSAAGAAAGWVLARHAREPQPGHPVLYAPPEGLGPVQAAYVANEKVPDQALQATLLYQAEQGLTRLEQTAEDAWVVEGIGTLEQWKATDPVTRWVGGALGVDRPGARFTADGAVGTGKILLDVKNGLGATTKQWARDAGYVLRSPSETTAKLLIVGAAALAAVGFVFNPFDITLMGLPFAAFVVGGLPLVSTGVGTRRTASGRDLWSRAGGFSRILSTPSGVERFGFSGRENLYTAYIPWAVAFGCAEEWAEKYETETGVEPAAPVWFTGTGWSDGGAGMTSALDSFGSSLSSSISAYQATQSSSSSGGGGGVGGGGGGGGGGSW
jgi:hypothetical protein